MHRIGLLTLALFYSIQAAAQTAIVKSLDSSGQAVMTSPSNPLPVDCVTGCSGSGGGGGGDASAANQTSVQATAGSDASKAVAVQGITGGKSVPVSATSLPLPTGAATVAKQPALGTAGTASADVITVQGIASGTALSTSSAQSGTWNITNVSGTVSLPTGAATAAKQPALGTAGSASADVITVQGVTSGTPLIVGGNVAGAASDSGNPVKVGCIYNSTKPTYTTGQRTDCQTGTRGSINMTIYAADGLTTPNFTATGADAFTNTLGSLNVSNFASAFNGTTWDRTRNILGAVAAGSAGTGTMAVEMVGKPYSHISTNATTTVKSGAGFLHTISINTKGITNTATVYDNTAGSGTVIAILDTTLSQDTLVYDLAFATGLTIVTAGGTSADITVTYR